MVHTPKISLLLKKKEYDKCFINNVQIFERFFLHSDGTDG